MTDRIVIGTDTAVANPDIGTQTFLGATVIDFSCNSSWDSQGGVCNINLIEDEGERISTTSVIGSPQYFEIVDNSGDLVFCFYGILKDISRNVSSNGDRTYSAALQTPTVLLSSCSIITEDYAGAGNATEAVAPNTSSSLDFGHINPLVTFNNVYNVLNPFGVFENDDYGLSTPKGFGASQVNEDGMRLDRFVAAIDELINVNNTTSNPELGRPIIYGADQWTNSPTAPQPYYYTFDINGFISQVSSFIPYDYRVKSTTLMDFVDELCTEINHVYMVDLKKPVGLGDPTITGPYGVASPPSNSEIGTFGGEIHIITQNRNQYGSNKFPLSKFIVQREISDKNGGYIPNSFSAAFSNGFGGADLPLDFAWTTGVVHPGGPAIASSPFGGVATFEDISTDELERYTSTQLSVSLNEGAVAGKMVTGGFQSRIGFIENNGSDVYQYWGEIKRLNNYGASATASDTAKRGIPVITKILDPNDIVDCVMIDCQDIVGTGDITGAILTGIYACSLKEMRYAMNSFDTWIHFLTHIKPAKLNSMETNFAQPLRTPYQPFLTAAGGYTWAGAAYKASALSTIQKHLTSSSNAVTTNIDPSDPINAQANVQAQRFLQMLHGKISTIGQDHYGKSWVVKQPAFTTKVDENEESVIADFVRSWDLSDSAYLEPANFAAYEAPQSPYFVKDGRLSSYVNFNSNFTSSNIYNSVSVNNDFSEYKGQKFAQTQIASDYIFSFPLEFDKDYLFLPSTYFTNYDRANFTNLLSGSGIMNNKPLAVGIDTANVTSAINYLTGAGSVISENGVGMIPYAICKTERVYRPLYTESAGGDSAGSNSSLIASAGFSSSNNQQSNKNIQGGDVNFKGPFPAIVAPRSFGIPQQSNRFIYGPWVTDNITLDYSAKIEYEQDLNLVPENYIIPATITIGGTSYTLTSGLAGLNLVGQAKANTVDNFNFLFTEQGSVTSPGLPSVTNLGASLVTNGPLVSDISVNISATDIKTTYNMKTFAPRLGRTNKRFIDNISKLGKKIKSIANLVK